MRPYTGGNPGQIRDPNIRESVQALHQYCLQLNQFVGRAVEYPASLRTSPGTGGGGGGGVTDHGALTGLADDDHTQYLLLAGRTGGQTIHGLPGAFAGTVTSPGLTIVGSTQPGTGWNGNVHFTLTPGSGLTLETFDSNTRAAWNMGTTQAAASLHIKGENGSANIVYLIPYSSSTGSPLAITGPGTAVEAFTVTANGVTQLTTYGSGQGAVDLLSLTNSSSGNNATVLVAVKGKSTQTGNLQEWRNSGGTAIASISAAGTVFGTALKVGTSSTVGYVLTATDTSGNAAWAAGGGGGPSLSGSGQVWTQENEWSLSQIMAGITWDPTSPSPSTPSIGKAKFFADSGANQVLPMWNDPNGFAKALQKNMGWLENGWWVPSTGTSVGVMNSVLGTTTGTLSTQSPGTSGGVTGFRGTIITSATTSGAIATMFENATHLWRGNATGRGGFYVVIRGGHNLAVDATPTNIGYGFLGLAAQATTISTTQPSNLRSCLGFGYDAGDAAYSFYSATSGATSKLTPSGSTLTIPGCYQFEIYCPPNGTIIYYRATNMPGETAKYAYGSVNIGGGANGPSTTAMMAMHAHTALSAAAAAIGSKVYVYRAYFEAN